MTNNAISNSATSKKTLGVLFLIVGLLIMQPANAGANNNAENNSTSQSLLTASTANLNDGDLISSYSYDGNPDIFIINKYGYKRLFLNPKIFGFYGHIGGFDNVKQVTPEIKESYITSAYFRNCETNDSKVFAVEVTGEDTGTLHHVNVSEDLANFEDPDFTKKIFCINSNEDNWYSKAREYKSLNEVPRYNRSTTPSTHVSNLPDYILQLNEIQFHQSINSPITFDMEVENQGGIVATATSTLQLKINKGLTQVSKFNFDIPILNPGQKISFSKNLTFNTTGYHEAIITADVFNTVRESNNDNNVLAYPFYVYSTTTNQIIPNPPDNLTATSTNAYFSPNRWMLKWDDNANNEDGYVLEKSNNISFSSFSIASTTSFNTNWAFVVATTTPSYYRVKAFNSAGFSGASNIVSISVKNPMPDFTAFISRTYKEDGAPIKFTIYIRNDGTIRLDRYTKTKFEIIKESTSEIKYTKIFDTPYIPPGESMLHYAYGIFDESGTYIIRATADYLNEAAEINESNNQYTYRLNITNINLTTKAADLAPELIILPSTPEENKNINFTLKARNIGNVIAANSKMEFYIIDKNGQQKKATYDYLGSINVNSSISKTKIFSLEAGTYTAKLIVDKNDNVAELNENNNEITKQFTVSGKTNLVNAPTNLQAVHNPAGNQSARFKFTWNDNSDNENGFIIEKSASSGFGSFEVASTTPPNITMSYINATTTPMYYRIKAFNDSGQSSPSNVISAYVPKTSVDLVSYLEPLSYIPETNKEVTFTVKVTNQGTEASEETRVSLEIEQTSNDDRVYFSTYTIPPLASGESYTVNPKYTFKTAGYFRIKARADYYDNVIELNESNNESRRTIKVDWATSARPDLNISELKYEPVNPVANDRVIFSLLVKNIGNATAPSTKVQCLNKTNGKVSFADVKSLQIGQSVRVYCSLILEDARTYSISINVDYSNKIEESNEANNTIIETITVQPKTTQVTCTDTDGGKNYMFKGTTAWGPINNETYTATDACDYTGNTLSERYCYYSPNLDGYYSGVEYINCKNGCQNGACLPTPTYKNILQNGSFENGTYYWTNWGAMRKKKLTTSVSYDGEQSVLLIMGDRVRNLINKITVDTTKKYRASAAIKMQNVTSGRAYVEIKWVGKYGGVKRIDTFGYTNGPNSDWTVQTSDALTVPTDAVKAKVTIVAEKGSGNVYFDDVKLEETTPVSSAVKTRAARHILMANAVRASMINQSSDDIAKTHIFAKLYNSVENLQNTIIKIMLNLL